MSKKVLSTLDSIEKDLLINKKLCDSLAKIGEKLSSLEKDLNKGKSKKKTTKKKPTKKKPTKKKQKLIKELRFLEEVKQQKPFKLSKKFIKAPKKRKIIKIQPTKEMTEPQLKKEIKRLKSIKKKPFLPKEDKFIRKPKTRKPIKFIETVENNEKILKKELKLLEELKVSPFLQQEDKFIKSPKSRKTKKFKKFDLLTDEILKVKKELKQLKSIKTKKNFKLSKKFIKPPRKRTFLDLLPFDEMTDREVKIVEELEELKPIKALPFLPKEDKFIKMNPIQLLIRDNGMNAVVDALGQDEVNNAIQQSTMTIREIDDDEEFLAEQEEKQREFKEEKEEKEGKQPKKKKTIRIPNPVKTEKSARKQAQRLGLKDIHKMKNGKYRAGKNHRELVKKIWNLNRQNNTPKTLSKDRKKQLRENLETAREIKRLTRLQDRGELTSEEFFESDVFPAIGKLPIPPEPPIRREEKEEKEFKEEPITEAEMKREMKRQLEESRRLEKEERLRNSISIKEETKNELDDNEVANAFNILNLPMNSTEGQIKKAYKLLAKKAHPDRGGTNAQFNELNNAYVLAEVFSKHNDDNVIAGQGFFQDSIDKANAFINHTHLNLNKTEDVKKDEAFNLLGMVHNSKTKDLRDAYKRMVLLRHPNKPNGNHQKYIEAQEAFKTVMKGRRNGGFLKITKFINEIDNELSNIKRGGSTFLENNDVSDSVFNRPSKTLNLLNRDNSGQEILYKALFDSVHIQRV